MYRRICSGALALTVCVSLLFAQSPATAAGISTPPSQARSGSANAYPEARPSGPATPEV